MNDVILYLAILAAIGWVLYSILSSHPSLEGIPVFNPPQRNSLGIKVQADKQLFLTNAKELIRDGCDRYGGPFVLNTPNGPRVVFPNSMADQIRHDPRLSFREAALIEGFSAYPGFDVILSSHRNSIMTDTVRTKLTQNLSAFTQALADEAAEVLDQRWGQSKEWHSIDLGDDVLYLIAHLSARVFLGEEMSHNEEWLHLSIDYTLVIFEAARALSLWPKPLRHIVVWFIPECVKLRATTKRARDIIGEVVARRNVARRQPGYEQPNDAIEWLEETANGRDYDLVGILLGLAIAAIHTTTDLTKQCLIDLSQRPAFVEELRTEVSEVLQTGNVWKKEDLPRLKLLDSAIKETQRMKPFSIVSMQRLVTADMPLPDGRVLPKGTLCVTSAQNMWDEKTHEKPDEYDGARFYRQRQEKGKENLAQLVTLSSDHMAFGYGRSACPGRFFVGSELKISLSYILSNFDLKLADEESRTPFNYGFEVIVNPSAKLAVRRRKRD